MENNKANEIWASGQVERLEVFRNSFPATEAGVFEMVRQLMAMCPSREDGEWLIDYAVKNEQFCPNPARLREILENHRCKPEG